MEIGPLTERGQIDLRTALWRGIKLTCPNCGQGSLFRNYLKQVDHCTACHEEFSHIRADDAPPWLTILIVGHIVVPLMFAVEARLSWQSWIAYFIWPIMIALLALAVLPRAKGFFIALIWATRSPGSEKL